ncbi:MAG: hypothetical protein ACJ79O_26940, partial [Myxococcales bacterium]
ADAHTQAEQIATTLRARRQEWDTNVAGLARMAAERQALEARRQTLAQQERELATRDRYLGTLREALVEWALLAKALGRDGLPILEVDQAGPTVAAYCNELLQASFGGRFTVDLVTQELKRTAGRDGSLYKDAFELKVYDTERGGEARDLGDLSGGEQTIVDEALKNAIALFLSARVSGWRTVWRDECSGSLDPENAHRYIAMCRRMLELGRYHHLFFVTHSADVARLADAQIVVADGRMDVALPPFAEAA